MMELKREVDSVTASMTAEELNNLVVSFRKPVKYAKVAVAKTLAKKVKLYKKKKKSSKKQEDEDQKRSEALQRQIDILSKAKVDKVTKFCLGLKLSFEAVAKKGVPEDIALSRVANQKLIKKKVTEWREKHSDWELLCAFLNTQISRRHKNRTSAIIKNEKILRQREKIADEEKKSKRDNDDKSKTESENDVMKKLVAAKVQSRTDDGGSEETEEKGSEDAESKEGEDSDDEETEVSEESSDDVEMEVTTKDSITTCEDKHPEKKKVDNFFLDSPFLEDDDEVFKASFSNEGEQKRKTNSKGVQNFSKRSKMEKNKFLDKKMQRSNRNAKFDQTTKNTKIVNNPSNKWNKSDGFSKKKPNQKDSSASKKDEGLHPSWAAKKKEKEQLLINFQCKRIEFDD